MTDESPMLDVQSGPADLCLAIDRVGVKNLELPLVVRDRAQGTQNTVARVDLGADLPGLFKGTHMSRLVQALEEWSGILDYQTVRTLLHDVRQRLDARRAYVRFSFPFFISKQAPVTRSSGLMAYQCQLTGELGPAEGTPPQGNADAYRDGEPASRPRFLLRVDVPVMTVCPCSKAISREGAHSQRAVVRISCRFKGLLWLEELIAIAERAGSTQLYSVLKREDEKHVTEEAFSQPAFVEDVVRKAAHELGQHPQITWYSVEVESFESIHNHSAFAGIERGVE